MFDDPLVDKKNLDKREISQQTGLLYGAQLMGSALNFTITFILANWLGKESVENYGIFSFCSVSVLGFTGLFFEFGLFAAGARLLAVSPDKKSERETLGALLIVAILLGFCMALFLIPIAPIIDYFFHYKVRNIIWVCAAFALTIPLQYLLELACQGTNRISSLALLRIILPSLAFLGVVFVFIFHSISPLSAIIAYNFGSTLACLIVAAYLRPSFANFRQHFSEIFLQARTFGFDIYVGRVMTLASQKLDGLLITYFLGYAPLGFYAIAKSAAESLIINFSRALAITRFRSFARSEKVSSLLILGNFLLSLFAGIGLVIVGPYFITWFLPSYQPSVGLLFPFVIGSIFGGLFQPYNLFLSAHGRGGELRNISIYVGISYLVALSFVIPFYGLWGAAWVIAGIAFLNFTLHRWHYYQVQKRRIDSGEIYLRILIIDLSGNTQAAESWAKSNAPQVEVKIFDKEDLRKESKLQWILKLRKDPYDVFAVYCDRLEWQTLLTPMLIFGFVIGAKTCVVVDSAGKELRRTTFTILFWEIFHLLLEIIGGFLLIIISWILTFLISGVSKLKFLSNSSRIIESNPSLLFIRTTPTSGSQTGGATSHISGFIQGALSLGIGVKVLSNDAISGVNSELSPVNIITPSRFFTAHRVLFELWNNLVFTLRSILFVRKDRPNFLYQRYSRFNWTGVVLSLITRIPLLLEYNGSEVWIGKYWDDVQLLWLLEAFEKLNLNAAASIFVVSEVERQNLLKRGIAAEKIFVNPNGVNPDIFHPDCGGSKIRSNLELQNHVVIGFVGTFGPWHGVEVIADAIKFLNKDLLCHFLFVGTGATKNKVEEKIRAMEYMHCVTFTGRVNHNKVAAYMDACDVLVSPQIQPEDGGEFFGSPTKLFEYMSMEKGIVASKVGQMKTILKDRENAILVLPNNPEELAKAFAQLAKDKGLCERLGKAARCTVIENYTWKHNAQRVLDVAAKL